MATSTAIRHRNRQEFNSVAIPEGIVTDRRRSKTFDVDTINVQDTALSLFELRKPGDRITSVTDATGDEMIARGVVVLDTLTVSDNTVLRKQHRRTLTDFFNPRDDGFITDRDLLRYRALSENLNLTDKLQKSVTSAVASVINSRVLTDVDTEVTDNTVSQFLGIVVKQLSDFISVADGHKKQKRHTRDVETINVAGAETISRTRLRLLTDNVTVVDDVIVTRQFIETEVISIDTFDLIDRIVASKSNPNVGVAAIIITGVEVI